jgi:hypothetical protein
VGSGEVVERFVARTLTFGAFDRGRLQEPNISLTKMSRTVPRDQVGKLARVV